MKRYILIGLLLFINSCSDNESSSNEVNMLKGETYTMSSGQTIVKKEDNSFIKLHSVKNGVTTAILISGRASIK